MKVLIADKLSPVAIRELEELGLQVLNHPDLSADDIPDHLNEVEILIVRSTKVTAKAIDASDNLSLIVRAGGRDQHHRCAGSQQPWYFCCQLPGQKQRRSGRIGHRLDDCRRPPDYRCSQRSSKGKVAQERIRQGSGLTRQNPGNCGFGFHWQICSYHCAIHGHEGHCLVQKSNGSRCQSARNWFLRRPAWNWPAKQMPLVFTWL